MRAAADDENGCRGGTVPEYQTSCHAESRDSRDMRHADGRGDEALSLEGIIRYSYSR